jgi:peptidyl-prolyl cis-trans isomerase SurA
VKNQLREFTDRVNNGETTFATLARLYSEDGSASQGGELGYTPRAAFDPAFAAVAFNLTDPKKVSKIVESEFGYHIIQLIDRRGERINVRHILLKPSIDQKAIDDMKHKLDTLANDIRGGKITFDDAAFISDDKDTRSNHGLMANSDESNMIRTSKFRMQDLPTEVAREVEKLQPGEVSEPFTMIDKRGKTVCAIIKLKNRTDSHRATITEDFQDMRDVVLADRREKLLLNWVKEKLKNTYVRMDERYRDCEFEYDGWVR